MKLIKGSFNSAKVYTDNIDEIASEQIKTICDMSIFSESNICIMPDVHAGAGCTIGTTMTIKDKVVPNIVGVDIGCGMELIQIAEKDIDLKKLDELIYERIPSGMNCRKVMHEYADKIDLSKLRCFKEVDIDLAYKSIGTLGGGNHFIEVDRDNENNIYLVIHSGSRHLGKEVAEYYQNEGYKRLCGNSDFQLKEMISKYKKEGREKEIQEAIKCAKNNKIDVPPYLAHVEGQLFNDYIHDMKITQEFAVLNRQAMADEIVKSMGLTVIDKFTTIHNYIDTENMILRKGAVSARKGERLLIPINMRDGALICVGKGNDDWNQSAPHGAGRLLSRKTAKSTLTLEEFKKEMKGIYSTSINLETLDESPMAYKSIDDIVDNIQPTVDVIKRILPIYNFKSSEEFSFKKNN